jgi:hypothetical protein
MEREGRLGRLLTERYRERLAGVLSCYDRIIVTGTLPGACYAKGMTASFGAADPRFRLSAICRATSWPRARARR